MASLTCINSMTLIIVDASYCILTCDTTNVTSTAMTLCAGRTSCSFTVDKSLFSDPCFGNIQTLQVQKFVCSSLNNDSC